MTLRQFEYFVAVVDEGSFTRAADRLFVTQPSLSKQVAALERELASTLIERLPRGVRLTQAGHAFLPEARAALRSEQRARRAAHAAGVELHGELEVATVLSISSGILPKAIRTLTRGLPGLTVAVREYLVSSTMEGDVRHGTADIAVGPAPAHWKGPIESLGSEELVLVLPPDDPLLTSGQGPVDLADLALRGWVLPDDSAGLTGLVLSACRAAGFSPAAVVRCPQVDVLARLAAAGVGPTLLPASIIADEFQPLVRRTSRPVLREVTVYTRTEWTDGTDALRLALRDARRSAGASAAG